MNEDNEKEVIENYDEEKNESVLQKILTIIFVIFIIVTSIFSGGLLFIVHCISWIILQKEAGTDDVLWKAYNKAFKIMGTLALVMLISFGACTAVLIGGAMFN